MIVGLGLTGLGNLVMTIWMDPYTLVFGRALMGLGTSLFFAVATTFVLNMLSGGVVLWVYFKE